MVFVQRHAGRLNEFGSLAQRVMDKVKRAGICEDEDEDEEDERVSGLVMPLEGYNGPGDPVRPIMSHFVTSPNTNAPVAMGPINQTFRTILAIVLSPH
ncbi:hypothetical protein M0802_009811 [Mischocyttarus mexicanus]|nr:hypothetical protein M0802_009811 [Mischocyttarus mexicanus]